MDEREQEVLDLWRKLRKDRQNILLACLRYLVTATPDEFTIDNESPDDADTRQDASGLA